MSRARHHLLDIYETYVYRTTTAKQWSKLRKLRPFLDEKAPGSAGFTQFVTWNPDGPGLVEPHIVVWINLKQHTSQGSLINTAAHEAAHAAGMLFEHLGHQIGSHDEPHAYLVGWLTEWLLDGLTVSAPD
ncbi:hypothetical protein EFK50_01115 [Nocardioides marmoriginsengisoli]|uniref:Uncharacterized protein n=1 Tax=Nocardioides marmoriginsengisoli TaxID=661483 RepID=A0A3N0CTC6_9ACTN|nr:hypothetical protein [Nocardioides marmoriginsengisoli]RNL66256.1 hypothetical protein EFK50_01115 [Nocardioides marmoriginsengisoli]